MNTSFFVELQQTIAERGRALLDRGRDRREMCGAIGAEEQYRVSLSHNRPLAKRESIGLDFDHLPPAGSSISFAC
jgi:hypothetical protein